MVICCLGFLLFQHGRKRRTVEKTPKRLQRLYLQPIYFKRYAFPTWAASAGYVSPHSNRTLPVHPSLRSVTIGQSSGLCVKSQCRSYRLVFTDGLTLARVVVFMGRHHFSFPCHIFALPCCWPGSLDTVASFPF